MTKRVLVWVEERTGLAGLLRTVTDGAAPGKYAWLKTTGFACLALVLVECVTGVALSFVYAAAPASAYQSVTHIEQSHLARFTRGLHHWASAELILLSAITVIRLLVTAGYRKRNDIVWLAALIFAQLVIAFQLTGHLLPWDTDAVATAQVEAGFVGNVWVVGPAAKRVVLGGGAVGGATLSRWYGLHAFGLPLVLVALVGLPLLAVRLRNGRAAEETAEEGTPAKPYYPFHMSREMVCALVAVLAAVALAAAIKTPLEPEATTGNLAGYQALAEWYVLPLHALAGLPPFNRVTFEPLATVLLPGALVTLLAALPFLERIPKFGGTARRAALPLAFTIVGAFGALYVLTLVRERPLVIEHQRMVDAELGILNPPLDRALADTGVRLYSLQSCDGCHSIAGKGGTTGPDLTHESRSQSDRTWQIAHLINPASKSPGSKMPAFSGLNPEQLRALAEYMVSLH